MRFCFRIKPEAGLATNLDTNEPAEAFAEVNLDRTYSPELHKRIAKMIAENLHLPENLVEPISEQEYDNNVESEDEAHEPS